MAGYCVGSIDIRLEYIHAKTLVKQIEQIDQKRGQQNAGEKGRPKSEFADDEGQREKQRQGRQHKIHGETDMAGNFIIDAPSKCIHSKIKNVMVGSAAINPPHLSDNLATSVTMAMTNAETKILVILQKMPLYLPLNTNHNLFKNTIRLIPKLVSNNCTQPNIVIFSLSLLAIAE